MNKNIIALGLIIFALPILSASAAESFPSSNIDSGASTINITSFNPSGNLGFSCSNSPIATDTSFTAAGWNDSTEVFDNLVDCFYSAGFYELVIDIVDNAGNPSTYSDSFTVAAGTPTATSTNGSYTTYVDGDSTNGVAIGITNPNTNGESELTLFMYDAHGNEVTNQAPRLHSPTTGSTFASGEFIGDANTGDVKFRGGLKLKETLPLSYGNLPSIEGNASPLNNGTFTVRALTTSIQKVGDSTVDELNQLNLNNTGGGWLSDLVFRDLDLVFSNLKEVDLAGNATTADATPITVTKPFRFINPFKSTPSVGLIEIDSLVDIGTETAKENTSINTTGITNGNINLLSVLGNYCPENREEACTNPDLDVDFGSDLNASLAQINSATRLFGEVDGSVIDDTSPAAFVTLLSYTLDGQNIAYPSGGLGAIFDGLPNTTIGLSLDVATVKFIGADVEGFVATNEDRSFLGTTSNQIVNIGLNSNKTDVYEKIVQNGWQLVRNSGNVTTSNGVADIETLFGEESVLVVDLSESTPANKTFTLNNLPAGTKTLVLVNGNLIIDNNLNYAANDDSFGVIVLRSDASPYPEVGNIFVRSRVKTISGSYFTDGAFANNMGDTMLTANQTGATKQLLLEGSLLSRNTLGGSLRNLGSNTDYTPWEMDASNSLARSYDLHYVRRYDPSAGHDGIAGELNTSAFIIRQDQKSTILSPPGFKVN